MVKSEADYLSKQVDKARSQLVLDFETWYAAEYEGGGADVNESIMGGGADVSADGEVMDDGEKFDRLEVERVMAQVPLPPSLPPHASLSSLPLAGVCVCKSDGKGVLMLSVCMCACVGGVAVPDTCLCCRTQTTGARIRIV